VEPHTRAVQNTRFASRKVFHFFRKKTEQKDFAKKDLL